MTYTSLPMLPKTKEPSDFNIECAPTTSPFAVAVSRSSEYHLFGGGMMHSQHSRATLELQMCTQAHQRSDRPQPYWKRVLGRGSTSLYRSVNAEYGQGTDSHDLFVRTVSLLKASCIIPSKRMITAK